MVGCCSWVVVVVLSWLGRCGWVVVVVLLWLGCCGWVVAVGLLCCGSVSVSQCMHLLAHVLVCEHMRVRWLADCEPCLGLGVRVCVWGQPPVWPRLGC